MQNQSANEHTSKPLDRIAIIGGGSAGWMAAAAICNAVNGGCEIVLVESEAIGTVGVGEATIPYIKRFNAELGIDERTFLRETKGSFKLGIEFVNWTKDSHRYFHPFGRYGADFDRVQFHHYWLKAAQDGLADPFEEYSMCWGAAKRGRFEHPMSDRRNIRSTFDYAYHFDAGLYARFLRRYAEARGCHRVEGKVVSVEQDSETGAIQSVTLEDGQAVAADFFIDCTGFRGLLIEGALGTGYEDWSHWLPADRAVTAACTHGGDGFTPYTRSTARDAGWQWRIPLRHRTGNGYVYCSQYTDDETATETLLSNLDNEALTDPRLLRFRTGRRNKFWNKNCLAIGLSAGFMEPLESTSLHLIHIGIARFLALFPSKGDNTLSEQEYNRLTAEEYEWIRDFLILHYKANSRTQGDLWRYVRNMPIPEALTYKVEQFQKNGRLVSSGLELFANPSWLAVFLGQGIYPERYDPLTDLRGVDGSQYLPGIRKAIDEAAEAMPSHADYIARYCELDAVSA
ncbi:MAG: tryptophan halogenase family protein [Pseudomonadota bacterium]